MGRQFGNLGVKVNGMIYYSISPNEQKAFAGFFTKAVPNSFRRLKEFFAPLIIPTVGFVVLYNWANNYHAKSIRKNPKDYENDV